MLTGITGQVSLGHAAFLCIGGFSVVAAQQHLAADFWLGLPLAAVAGALVGVLVGLPAARFRGIYLAISTLAMHYAIVFLAKTYQARLGTSASEGIFIRDPQIAGYVLADDRHWYYVLLLLCLVVTWLSLNAMRTRTGRAWIAIRDRDVSAEAVGINLTRYKLSAFVVSSALASFLGGVVAYYTNSVSSDIYTIDIAVVYLAMVIVGGLGSPLGAILGAFFITFLPYAVEAAFAFAPASWRSGGALFAYQLGATGLCILLFLVFEPRGLVEIWRRLETYFERWPFRYRALSLQRK
jgi:branched-chain amino acid transport system permease protein